MRGVKTLAVLPALVLSILPQGAAADPITDLFGRVVREMRGKVTKEIEDKIAKETGKPKKPAQATPDQSEQPENGRQPDNDRQPNDGQRTTPASWSKTIPGTPAPVPQAYIDAMEAEVRVHASAYGPKPVPWPYRVGFNPWEEYQERVTIKRKKPLYGNLAAFTHPRDRDITWACVPGTLCRSGPRYYNYTVGERFPKPLTQPIYHVLQPGHLTKLGSTPAGGLWVKYRSDALLIDQRAGRVLRVQRYFFDGNNNW